MTHNIIYNNLNNDSPKINQGDNIMITLKEHQKTAINAMLQFEETGKVTFEKKAFIHNYQIIDNDHYRRYYYWRGSENNDSDEYNSKFKNLHFEIESNYGILADKIGSGKTFMTMGVICNKQIPYERDRIISSSVYTVMKYKDKEKAIKTNLILVPHNLIHQWKNAFEYCKLKTYTISKKADIDFLDFDENIFKDEPTQNNLDTDINEKNCIEYYDTIIISSTMFDIFYNKFNPKWARVFIDEIVSIKLPTNFEFKTNFIWFLTATPSGIRYVKRTYIRSLVHSLTNNTIENLIIKNNDEFVDQSMNLPNLNQILVKCLTPKEFQIIKEYVSTDVINMLNAGDIKGAITKLNCNVETSDNILEVVTNKIKKELHNKKHELDYEQKKIPDDKKAHDEKIKRIENRILELESKCNGIESRIKSFKENNCPVCLCEFDSPMLTSCCNNLFCIQCLTLCKNCPLCRADIDLQKCIFIDDNKKIIDKQDKKENVHTLCSKIDNLITIFKKKPNGKFLLFSNYDRTFDNLNQKLNDNCITYNKLVGSNIVINSIIKRFISGEIKVLMLNALNYGSGLNLQMATDIIIYHELDVELETQVIGRAQRLGRTEPLNVYYLLNENEKVNCNNPTLNLDIFADDVTMLEKFIKNNNNIGLNEKEDSDTEKEQIIIKKKVIKNKLTKSVNVVTNSESGSELNVKKVVKRKIIKKKTNSNVTTV